MILNYQKKIFFKKTINFNDFKLSKKKFFSKIIKILMIFEIKEKYNFF